MTAELPTEELPDEENGEDAALVPDEEYRRTPPGTEAVAATVAAGRPVPVRVYDPTVVRLWEDLLRARQVYVFGDIDPEAAARVIESLHWLDRRGEGPITVHVSSPGGDVLPGFAIVDAIRQARSPTVTVGYGNIASIASVILQAGQSRRMTGRAWYMIHEITTIERNQTTTQTEDDLALLKRMQGQMLDLYTERSRVKREDIEKKWKRKDWWLDAHEALKLGFIDGIVEKTEAPPTEARARKPRARRTKEARSGGEGEKGQAAVSQAGPGGVQPDGPQAD